MRRSGLLSGLAGLAVLAAGCTQVSAGEPRPATPEGGTESSQPNRPRDVDLTGKDPCALVPESDLHGFDVDKVGEQARNEQFDAPECRYSGNAARYYLVLVTSEGIESWTGGSRNAEVAKTDPVEGFPAITVEGDLTPNRCDVVVDVADGQYLRTTVLPHSTKATFAESCGLAHGFAESAMSTLLGE